MGIRGLGAYLKWRLPHVRKPASWTPGTRWGIDCSCLQYRAAAAGLSQVTLVASLIFRMRIAGVEPVVVFDGKPPVTKAAVTEKRRAERVAATQQIAGLKEKMTAAPEAERQELEVRVAELKRKTPQVSRGDRDDVKRLLYAAGVQFITAIGEADDLLAFLCVRGDIQAVLSTDMDMLARRVPVLIVPETEDARILTEIRLADVLRGLGLTYEQFVTACVLMGSDYSERVMTPPQAVDVARTGILRTEASLLMGSNATWESLVSEKQREKWAAGPPPREKETVEALGQTLQWPARWVAILGPT